MKLLRGRACRKEKTKTINLTKAKLSPAKINIPQTEIADFCRRHHFCRLALFGSILRDDFRPDSDVDVLVEFEPGYVPGLLRLTGMEVELSELDGRTQSGYEHLALSESLLP